ncbi:nucleotidyltransferase domain-containing protein [Roseibium sp. RP-7]
MTDFRSRYLESARRVAVSTKERGVEVRLVGSLARGTDFDASSDIDFLVLDCPEDLRSRRRGHARRYPVRCHLS